MLVALKLPDKTRIYDVDTTDYIEARQAVIENHPKHVGSILALIPKTYETITNQVA